MVDRREFLKLLLRLFLQFPAFLFNQGLLAVLLAADGHVFAQGHGDCAAHQAGSPSDQDGSRRRIDTSDANHDRRNGDDTVIGTQHAGAEPVQALCNVVLVRLIIVKGRGSCAVHSTSKALVSVAGQYAEATLRLAGHAGAGCGRPRSRHSFRQLRQE